MADELPESMQKVLERIPPEWGKWISCGPGWFSLIGDLDGALSAIDPDYVVHQCKEKFGGLRYYIEPSSGVDEAGRAAMEALVSAAEARSFEVDEWSGELRS